MTTRINDSQFKELLDLFYDMNLCDKNEDISDEIDCEYSFKPTDANVRVTRQLFNLIPENWSVRYFESVEKDIESCFDFTRHFHENVEVES